MFEALIGAVLISLLSLIGVFVYGKSETLHGVHHFILPMAVGVFLGVVFFELVPETLTALPTWGPVAIVAGFLGFYLLSYVIDTFHHHHTDHKDDCVSNGARKLLIGDMIHNISDGVVVASAFMINPVVGALTTFGVALHEIPQEIAEFGVLLQSGYSKRRAALYNLLSATGIIVGVFLTFLFLNLSQNLLPVLTGVAAGNLLYIATADLIPELRESHRDHFAGTFIATLIGVATIGLLLTYSSTLVG